MSNQKHYRELIKDTIQYMTMGGLFEASNMLLLPFIARSFTKSEYGMYDSVLIMIALLGALLSLCIPSGLVRMYHEYDAKDQKRLVTSLLIIGVIVGAIAYSGSWICVSVVNIVAPYYAAYTPYLRIAALAGALNAIFSIVLTVMRVERRILASQLLSLGSMLANVSGAIIIIYLFNGGMDELLYVFVISQALGTLVGIVVIRKYLVFAYSHTIVRNVLWYSLPMVPATLASWFNTRGCRYILVMMLGIYSSGIYAVGVRVASVLMLVINAFQQAWAHYSVALLKSREYEGLSEGMLLYYMAGISAIAIFIITFNLEIVHLLAGPGYESVCKLFPWLLGAMLLRGMSAVANVGAIVHKRSHYLGMAMLMSVIVNIIGMVLLTPVIGLLGAAVANFVAMLASVVLLIRDTHRNSQVQFDYGQIFIIAAIYLVTANLLVADIDVIHSLWVRVLIGTAGIVVLTRFTVLRKMFAHVIGRFRFIESIAG